MADISEMIKKVQSKKAKKKFTRGNRPGKKIISTQQEPDEGVESATLPQVLKAKKKSSEAAQGPVKTASKNKSKKNKKKSSDTVVTQSLHSDDTVVTQMEDSDDTVMTQSLHSNDTVVTQMKDSGDTVTTQSLHSDDTVVTQMEDSGDTVMTQSLHSDDTVVTQMKDSGDTVTTQSLHSEDTVVTQMKDSGDTVTTQSPHNADTVVTQKKDSDDTVATKVATQYLHSGDTLKIEFEDAYYKYIRMNGNRKTVADFLCKTLIDNGITMLHGLTYDLLAKRLQIKVTSIRNTIKRIEKEGLLKVQANGSGPGTTLTITVADALLKSYSKAGISETKMVNLFAESRHSGDTSGDTVSSSSSSSLNNNIETTTKKKISLPEEWMEIQIPESLKKIRFGIPQLKQIYNKEENELTPAEVQESLDNMAYDIESGTAEEKKFKSPLHILMSVLINGQPYFSEALIKASEEAVKKQKDLFERYKQAQKDEAEKKLSEKFEEYFKTLTQADINKIVPPNNIAKEGSTSQKMILRSIFSEKENL